MSDTRRRRFGFLRRRPRHETERELHAGRDLAEPPGGAEGGDEGASANRNVLPARDDRSPLGDTDQHSSDRPARYRSDEPEHPPGSPGDSGFGHTREG